MDGAIRSRKKRDRRDVLPDDAGAVAVLINEILRDLAGINHFAVLQRDDILRVGIAGDPVRAGEGSALTGEEVLLGKAHKPHVAGEQALRRLADAVGEQELSLKHISEPRRPYKSSFSVFSLKKKTDVFGRLQRE